VNLPPHRPGARCMVMTGRHAGAVVVLKKLMPALRTRGVLAWYIMEPIPIRYSIETRRPNRWVTGFAQRILLPLDDPLPAEPVDTVEELGVAA
jgi:hypothetical protein